MVIYTALMPDLIQRGPIIQILIFTSEIRRLQLENEEKDKIPTHITTNMMIDTGASMSAISKDIASKLNLKAHGTAKIHTPSDTSIIVPTYDIDIGFPHPSIIYFQRNLRVIEARGLEQQKIDGLLGRDVLKNILLIYNGSNNSFTLSI